MRVRWLSVCSALTGAIAVSACAPTPDVARHTVAEYRSNAVLRQAQMALCANDPGTLWHTPDCVNARDASQREDTGSLRELPPLTLPRGHKPYAQDVPGR